MILRSYRLATSAVLTLLVLAPALQAQTPHKYTVKQATNELRVIPEGGVMNNVILDENSGALLHFDCDQTSGQEVDCTALSVAVFDPGTAATARPDVSSSTATEATVTIKPNTVGNLAVRIGNEAANPTIRLVAAGTPEDELSDDELIFVRRREVECAIQAGISGGYSKRANLAEVVVATDGFVIGRPPLPVDENDRLIVHVVGDPDVLRTVRVVRTSEIRDVGQFRAVGLDEAGRIQRHAFSDECGIARAELADFAPGEGVFQITTTNPETRKPATADVSLRVNPVYSGAFSFGPVLTGLRDRSYTLLADSTVAETTAGKTDGAYVLSYTHFVRGPYDVEKTRWVGINPMIGISLTDPLDSIYGGVTIDISRGAAYIQGGLHGREVTRLINRDDIAVGSRLPEDLTSVPTREVWRWSWFVGVGVDLRAAIGLFGKVLTG